MILHDSDITGHTKRDVIAAKRDVTAALVEIWGISDTKLRLATTPWALWMSLFILVSPLLAKLPGNQMKNHSCQLPTCYDLSRQFSSRDFFLYKKLSLYISFTLPMFLYNVKAIWLLRSNAVMLEELKKKKKFYVTFRIRTIKELFVPVFNEKDIVLHNNIQQLYWFSLFIWTKKDEFLMRESANIGEGDNYNNIGGTKLWKFFHHFKSLSTYFLLCRSF